MSTDPILFSVEKYYTGRVKEFGATPRGVDWNSSESQTLRFSKMACLLPRDVSFSLLDYGCGYGALLDFLVEKEIGCAYLGFDISEEMVQKGRQLHQNGNANQFFSNAAELKPVDYVMASGIFNVRLQSRDEDWKNYMLSTVDRISELAIRGFAFNVLSLYSDPEYRRHDLYYADPLFWFDHCKRKYSRFVSLLHDYPLYEFTILVRK